MQALQKTPLILLVLLLAFTANACSIQQGNQAISLKVPHQTTDSVAPNSQTLPVTQQTAKEEQLNESLPYDSKDDVALYVHTYGRLPVNYITKAQARALGWPGGDLRPFAPNNSIGGDRFRNYEGLLPAKKGRVYYECDIDTLGSSSRGKKRIVFSNDGLVYYTDDHYESFTLLYGGEQQ